jgi:hypothetical protein
MKEKSASSILQDVAVNSSDVESEHAPEHALIISYKYSLNSRMLDVGVSRVIPRGGFHLSPIGEEIAGHRCLNGRSQLRAIFLRIPDCRTDLPRGHSLGWKWAQQIDRCPIGISGIEPSIIVRGRENHRHSIMHWLYVELNGSCQTVLACIDEPKPLVPNQIRATPEIC